VQRLVAQQRRQQQQQQQQPVVAQDHWLDHWPLDPPRTFFAQLMGLGFQLQPELDSAGGAAATAAASNADGPSALTADNEDDPSQQQQQQDAPTQGASVSSSSSSPSSAAAAAASEQLLDTSFDWAPLLAALAPPAIDLGTLADARTFASAIVGDMADLEGEPLRLICVAAHQPGGGDAAALVFAWECRLAVVGGGGAEGVAEDGAAAAGAAASDPQQQQPENEQQQGGKEQEERRRPHWPEMTAHLGAGPGAVTYRVLPRALPSSPQLCVEGLTFLGGSTGAGGGRLGVAGDGTAGGAPECVGSGTGSSSQQSDDGWHTYFLAVRGGFSLSGPHHTTFPNVIAHLGDGRVCHNARALTDVAAFVAQPIEAAVREHAANLVRCAVQRHGAVLPPQWCFQLLQARWGAEALRLYGIGVGTLLAMGL